MRLLCLSNGHGEDVIAVRILQELQQHPNAPELAALPLVGEGHAYSQLGIPIIGGVQGGLVQLTWAQFKAVRRWIKRGGVILAVGDIVPLLFAGLSGAPYAFVGTAKSEYYVRDEAGWLPNRSFGEKWFGAY